MSTKEGIIGTSIFKIALSASVLLLLSSIYADQLWSELWLVFGVIQIGIILFFAVTLVWALGFWITKRKKKKKAYVPIVMMAILLGLVLILPLDEMRNKLKFTANKILLEKVADQVLSENAKITEYPTVYKLDPAYQFLSVTGDVIVINKQSTKGVLFYTFRGVPDGMRGFLKIKSNAKVDDFKDELYINAISDLGDNWYYISCD